MKLSELLELIDNRELINFKDAEIRGVKTDSRKTGEGDVFVCLRGKNFDGHTFSSEAIENGASVIISECFLNLNKSIPLIVVPSTKKAYSLIAQKFYSLPANKLKLIGVTGTTGKTSVAYLIYKALNLIGKRASLIGTAGYYSLNNKLDIMLTGPVTTPEPMELNSLFRRFLDDGSEYVVLEASSFGLAEERLFGLEFDVSVLTNISFNHHINYHGSFESYVNSKTKLFKQTKIDGFSILNRNCEYFDRFSVCSSSVISFGSHNKADIRIEEIEDDDDNGIIFKFSYKGRNYSARSALPCLYNALNIIASFGVGLAFNLNIEDFLKALTLIDRIPGRWDKVKSNHPATIVIDKANTPLAIENVSNLIMNKKYKKRIAVFGNVGGGNKGERKMMANLISALFDLIVLTTDDPENENPEIGFSDFLEGLRKEDKKKCIIEEDRREAISKALSIAGSEDLLVILGRGNQREFLIKGKTLDFDDTVEIRKILTSKGYAVED